LVRVSHKDALLEHAIAVAKQGLPMFTAALKHHSAKDRFAIKARFKTPDGPEYLWLKDPSVTPSGFEGTVDQQPVAARVRLGERVKLDKGDVCDWMVQTADGQKLGAFTDLALQSGQ
jgi:uncharacterized protein YegJ (DUF2314 family)